MSYEGKNTAGERVSQLSDDKKGGNEAAREFRRASFPLPFPYRPPCGFSSKLVELA